MGPFPIPPCRLPTALCPLFAGVNVKPLPHDRRRPRPQLRRLDPPQDQLGIRLANGEGTHALFIGRAWYDNSRNEGFPPAFAAASARPDRAGISEPPIRWLAPRG